MNPELAGIGERRRSPRMVDPISARVRGSDSDGGTYGFDAFVGNISAGGLCACAPRSMRKGERVSLRIRFARYGSTPVDAPEVPVEAVVVRVEKCDGNFCAFAVSFLRRERTPPVAIGKQRLSMLH